MLKSKNLINKIISTKGKYEAIFGVLSFIYLLYGVIKLSLPVPVLRDGEKGLVYLDGVNLVIGLIGLLVYGYFLLIPFIQNWLCRKYNYFIPASGAVVGLLIFGFAVNESY